MKIYQLYDRKVRLEHDFVTCKPPYPGFMAGIRMSADTFLLLFRA
jgi:hypothetical protein